MPKYSTDAMIQIVQQWATARGIDQADPDKQALKLTEEVGELAAAIIRDDTSALIDAIGDATVVLIILCQQIGIDLHTCLAVAYKQIAGRTGRTVNGVFVKDEDLRGGHHGDD